MTRDLVVIGAGGFGREVLDVVDAINASTDAAWSVRGVVDDAPSQENLERLAKRGVTYLGGSAEVLDSQPAAYVVGIGSPSVRTKVALSFDAAGWSAATLIHPTVTQGFDVTIGAGSVLCAGVRLTTNIRLGRHVHVNLNSTIGHDTTIEDFVSINPLASISGDCTIESGVLVGVAGIVLNGLRIGADSTVGGSACVVRDVPAETTVKGVPAR
ncbi:acetyltransferase [Nocardioides dubius]|uniref:Acetyltransferase n=1 Tax=Nocardioides dubius TaxID=317019 RepID=A0ABP4EFY6_9ACTN